MNMYAKLLPAAMGACALALGLGATASSALASSTYVQERLRPGPGHPLKQRHALDGYGRGYQGYDPRARYGNIALKDGQTSHRRRWNYSDGFPVYVYPSSAAVMIRNGSEYEQFQQEEQEAVMIDGDEDAPASGKYCATAVLSCRLYQPASIGSGCSCRAVGSRLRGEVSR